MILIFGGAYQGKTDYAKSQFDIKNVWDCSDGREPKFDVDCITGIEGFVFECAKSGIEAKTFFAESQTLWKDKILVITDTSQGVVPIDKNARAAREMNGRLMLYLAAQAEQIYRVFCGIGKRIK